MFRQVRGDTLVFTIEARYNIDLNVRGDALLGNLLDDRGFASLNQLLKAYRGQATEFGRDRRLFLCFHEEDRQQIGGFRLMARNPNLDFFFIDDSVRTPIDSANASYVAGRIREKINRASVLVCLIGNATAWRDWVDWEIETAAEMGKGLCGVRLRGSRGPAPQRLGEMGAPIARWDLGEIIAVIECAAARRS
jgi:hypothetical protein